MDTKGIDKFLIYNFIDVTLNFHKLFEALVPSRLSLALPTYVTKILIWLLFVVFFWAGKKKIHEMSSHCFKYAKLHFHLPFQQSSYRCRSSNFNPFFTKFLHKNPPLNPHHLEIFIFLVLDNITFYVTTLALGSRSRQEHKKMWAVSATYESHSHS
jgi:hypothetical protein